MFTFVCAYMYVGVGHLGVWGELINHKRSLTHRPSSHFVFDGLCFSGVVWIPYLSYVVCYTFVLSCSST